MDRLEKRYSAKEYKPITTVDKPSSQIIKEAKEWYRLSLIETKRPSTPQDHRRSLYDAGRRQSGSRPSSAVTFDPSQLDASDPSSRPSSGAKLPPLSLVPKLGKQAQDLVGKQSSSTASVQQQVEKARLNPNNDPTEFSIRRSQKRPTRSPIKAVHPEASASNKADDNSNVTCYHPTPPPMRLSNQKALHAKGHVVVVPTSEDESVLTVASTVNSASSSSSAGSLGLPSEGVGRKQSPGSGNSGKVEESADEAFYWNQNILPIIEQLQDVASADVQNLCQICSNLSSGLEKGSCFSHMSSRRRMSLLSVLFKLLNNDSSDVILSCASIILRVRVHNKNLISICTLIFRICKKQQNDELFSKYNIISSMLAVVKDVEDPISKYENYQAFSYLLGSLKFLSNNKNILNTMYSNGCVSAILQFITTTVEVTKQQRKSEEIKKLTKYATDLLVQVTTTLRNILDLDKRCQQSVVGCHTLLTAFTLFCGDEELVWIFSRVFSKLTMYSSCQNYFAGTDWFKPFLYSLKVYKHNSDVVVRLCFALGNLVARSDELRRTLCFNANDPESFLETPNAAFISMLLDLVDHYNDQLDTIADKTSIQADKARDVLIKIVRVIANMSIGEDVGHLLACHDQVVDRLLDMLESRSLEESEELIVNLLTTLNNLSYYDGVDSEGTSESAVTSKRLRLTSLLSFSMMSDNMTCVAEVARVLGNLTRHQDVRNLVHQHKVDLMMVALLDSGDRQVVYNACGVLINISADQLKRPALLNERAVSKLTDVIHDFAPLQWNIGGVACQLLWNLCSSTEINEVTENELIPLLKILQNFTDQQYVLELSQINVKDERSVDYVLSAWKESFYSYGKQLIGKLMSKMSVLEPLSHQQTSSDFAAKSNNS